MTFPPQNAVSIICFIIFQKWDWGSTFHGWNMDHGVEVFQRIRAKLCESLALTEALLRRDQKVGWQGFFKDMPIIYQCQASNSSQYNVLAELHITWKRVNTKLWPTERRYDYACKIIAKTWRLNLSKMIELEKIKGSPLWAIDAKTKMKSPQL